MYFYGEENINLPPPKKKKLNKTLGKGIGAVAVKNTS